MLDVSFLNDDNEIARCYEHRATNCFKIIFHGGCRHVYDIDGTLRARVSGQAIGLNLLVFQPVCYRVESPLHPASSLAQKRENFNG